MTMASFELVSVSVLHICDVVGSLFSAAPGDC